MGVLLVVADLDGKDDGEGDDDEMLPMMVTIMAMIQPDNLLSNIQGWEEKEKEKLLKKQRHCCFHLFSEDKDNDYS